MTWGDLRTAKQRKNAEWAVFSQTGFRYLWDKVVEKPVLENGLCNQALHLLFHTTGRDPRLCLGGSWVPWMAGRGRLLCHVTGSAAAEQQSKSVVCCFEAWHRLFLLTDVTSFWPPLLLQPHLVHVKYLLGQISTFVSNFSKRYWKSSGS